VDQDGGDAASGGGRRTSCFPGKSTTPTPPLGAYPPQRHGGRRGRHRPTLLVRRRQDAVCFTRPLAAPSGCALQRPLLSPTALCSPATSSPPRKGKPAHGSPAVVPASSTLPSPPLAGGGARRTASSFLSGASSPATRPSDPLLQLASSMRRKVTLTFGAGSTGWRGEGVWAVSFGCPMAGEDSPSSEVAGAGTTRRSPRTGGWLLLRECWSFRSQEL
jgi:hypothetical protein